MVEFIKNCMAILFICFIILGFIYFVQCAMCQDWTKGYFCNSCNELRRVYNGICPVCGESDYKQVAYKRVHDSTLYEPWTWFNFKFEIKNPNLIKEKQND